MPLWPVIVGMIFTQLVVIILASLMLWLSYIGLANIIVLNNEKECLEVVDVVNNHWYNETRTKIALKINEVKEKSNFIEAVYIDSGFGVTSVVPTLEGIFTEAQQKKLNENGVVRFLNPEKKVVLHNPALLDDEKSRDYVFNQRKIIKTFFPYAILNSRELSRWASNEIFRFHVISIYRTQYPGINVCIKHRYIMNSFHCGFIFSVSVFVILLIVVSLVYEISKLVSAISERRAVNRIITTDKITGGYNKEYFMQKAEKEICKNHKQYAVVQLRLEKYRNYCTAYGLKQGEMLLEEINNSLVNLLAKKEYVAHIEKSDFALFLNYFEKDSLTVRVRNMMNVLRERRGSQHLTFSAGICPVSSRTEDIEGILACAGVAVPHLLKMQDEIVWFNDSMKEAQVWERRIEDDMEKALENREFQVYLQPKYSTKKEVLSAAEALVRWIHPSLGFISPGQFIPLFEKNGFILQLDDYMLTEISKLQANWASQGRKLVPISVNISRAHFAEENLAEHICAIVDEFNVPHEFIELELTESAFFDDKNVLLSTVRKLKASGFKVSMDDFGAGYSSLNSLKELPLDIIKLDAEFFRSVDDIQRSNLIVSDTISLAKKLGMQIVAEGIETREQVDFLAKQDCDLIQGFYFSKPLPVEEFEKCAYPGKS